MKSNTRISFKEREFLSRSFAQGQSISESALGLGRAVSSITRELERTGMNQDTYRAEEAQMLADQRKNRIKRPRKIEINQKLKTEVLQKLSTCWSPEQIAHFLKKEYSDNMSMQISHESIYTYIYILPRGAFRKELTSYLRQGRVHRRNRRKNLTSNRGKILDMVSIHERPKEVEDRIVPGHWESDLIVGKNHQSAIGTLVERTTRTTILVPLKGMDAETVRLAFAKEVKKLPKQMKLSITHDRGKEMSEHILFTKETKVQVYFADPQSPWQRGTNENTNGLIRQFFPKGTDFRKVTTKEIKYVQHLLNGRPRKTLNWLTPYEVFGKLLTVN